MKKVFERSWNLVLKIVSESQILISNDNSVTRYQLVMANTTSIMQRPFMSEKIKRDVDF